MKTDAVAAVFNGANPVKRQLAPNHIAINFVFLTCLLFGGYSSQAAEVLVNFDNPAHSELYYKLLREYRCLKCQNQNLADSKAGLADDLRREIREQILSGKTARDIDEYLVSRYGEFVLYRPRFSMKTAVLWIAPFALLLLALTCLYVMISRLPRRAAVFSPEKEGAGQFTAADSASRDAELGDRLERAKRLLDD